MGIFSRLKSKNKSKKTSVNSEKLAGLKCRKIHYVGTDFDIFLDSMKDDSKAILSLVPVNYYAVKNEYIIAYFYTDKDYCKNYIKFEKITSKGNVKTNDLFELDFHTLSNALAKVGIIIVKPEKDIHEE